MLRWGLRADRPGKINTYQGASSPMSRKSAGLIVPPAAETALAMTPDRAVRVTDDADYDTIRQLQAQYGAIDFPGASRIDKLHMLGIPFVVVGVRFQDVMPKESGGFRDYVTIDAFVADEATVQAQIDRGRVMRSVGRDAECYTDIADLPVKPEERVIINDGSTGVRRQIVQLLDYFGLIRVGHDDLEQRRYDLAWNEWDDPAPAADAVSSSWLSAAGTEIPAFRSVPDGRPLIVTAARGLHGSVYPSEFAPSGWATTYYVA